MSKKTAAKETPLPDQAARKLIKEALDSNILVEAAAGTGKTASMVARMVEILRTGMCKNIRSMAAVTFTRKASAELRSRFRIKLEEAVREEKSQAEDNLYRALLNIEQCFIGTIHSFCGRLLRERPVEAGIDPTFEELDENTDLVLRGEAWAEYSSRVIADDSHGILEELDELGLSLSDLQNTFGRFTDYPDVTTWPVSDEKPDFKALDPVREQVMSYVAHMRSLAPKLPATWGNDTLIPRYRRLPRMVSHYGSLDRPSDLMKVIEEFDHSATLVQKEWSKDGAFTKDDAKSERARWDEFGTDVVQPALRLWREWRYGPILRVMIRARIIYDTMRSQRRQLSYGDLLMRAAQLLRDKPHVRAYFQNRFTHLLVDEFQDTDPIQAEVMLLLTASDVDETDWRKVVPRPGSLFVVGDPKQSIYRFRRADIVTYNDVKSIIQQSTADKGMVVELSSNFRTTDSLISWVNEIFGPDAAVPFDLSEAVVRFDAKDSPESPRYVRLETARVNETSGTLSGVYSLTIPPECKNKNLAVEYEAERIARTIRHALDNPSITIPRTKQEIEQGRTEQPQPSDFLIINRIRPSLSVYAGKLEEYGIPTQVSGGSALNQVQEVKMLYTCLNALMRPDDPVALVAVLRGPIFGISDVALYGFKKAGGRFSFNSRMPDDLDGRYASLFQDAFARMRRYSLWLTKMPPLAALEMMVADLGLMVLAALRPGGDVQAGSVAKALEILRSIQHQTWTTAQLVEQLGEVINLAESYDGVSAGSTERPAVRIMNLHRVKGLEAPVVFLANPYGDSAHDVALHIDRSSGDVIGYLAVYGEPSTWTTPLLAHPPEWDDLAQRESRFLEAEALRLRYVAATRAGAALIVTRKDSGSGRSPWKYFHEHLGPDREIEDFGPAAIPVEERISITVEEEAQAQSDIADRFYRVLNPTYDAWRAKEYALAQGTAETTDGQLETEQKRDGALEEIVHEGEHGLEWGTLVHTLLQLAMNQPAADLNRAAMTVSSEQDLEVKHGELAAKTVKAVMKSEIWVRAQRSEQRLTEVPFQVLIEEKTEEESSLPTILRGAIDLVFKENGGWVVIDYKTNIVGAGGVQEIVDKYAPQLKLYSKAWKSCTGEDVVETGLYLVQYNRYIPVQL
jgi:ATP-dependent helicase/nuclease subunit A